MRSFSRAEHDELVANVVVAVTWEPAFLVVPGGSVWTRSLAGDRCESLLPSPGAADTKLLANVALSPKKASARRVDQKSSAD